MKKSHMKAATLRTFMSIVIFLAICLLAVGFYYTQNWLRNYAAEANILTSNSATEKTDPQAIKKLQDEITKYQASADKVNSITVSSQNYQSKITQDLNKYASNTGIKITNLSFAQPTSDKGNTSTPASSLVTVTLNNPVKFTNLMQFIKSIEGNLPKMQPMGINLSRVPNSVDTIKIEPLTIKVYIK